MQFTKVIIQTKILHQFLQYTLKFFCLIYYILCIIFAEDPSPALNHFNKLIAFSTKSFEISFKQAGISAKATISLFMEPYLNIIKISMRNLESMEAHFFNSVPTKRNNLFQTTSLKQECWIHNPQICQVLHILLISVCKTNTLILTFLNILYYRDLWLYLFPKMTLLLVQHCCILKIIFH